MSANPATTSYDPMTTLHAANRLRERFPRLSARVETLWARGVRAELPDKDFDDARYYPPAELAIGRSGSAIVTVLDAEATRVHTPHALACGNCDQPIDGEVDEACPWCGDDSLDGRTTGQIELIRSGGE